MRYYRVTVKNSAGKRNSFWAQIISKGSNLTIYRKVNNEGDDFGYFDKNDALVDRQHLFSNSLIISEKPAFESLLYGTLVLDTPKNRKINADVKKTHQKISKRKNIRITPKTPRLRR